MTVTGFIHTPALLAPSGERRFEPEQSWPESSAASRVAYDGAAALELIPMTKPDLVLMDLKMPGLNGI